MISFSPQASELHIWVVMLVTWGRCGLEGRLGNSVLEFRLRLVLNSSFGAVFLSLYLIAAGQFLKLAGCSP